MRSLFPLFIGAVLLIACGPASDDQHGSDVQHGSDEQHHEHDESKSMYERRMSGENCACESDSDCIEGVCSEGSCIMFEACRPPEPVEPNGDITPGTFYDRSPGNGETAEMVNGRIYLKYKLKVPEHEEFGIDCPWLDGKIDVYHGESPDPPLIESDPTLNGLQVPNLKNNTVYYWKLSATFDQNPPPFEDCAVGTYVSDIWSYQTSGTVDGCPGNETAIVQGEEVATVKIADRCWLPENLGWGELPDNGYALDDGVVQRECIVQGCHRGLYTWYEAHNSYPDLVGDVSTSICPNGFRLPTTNEWTTLMESLENPIGRRFYMDGQARPPTTELKLCTNPDNPDAQIKCSTMGPPEGSNKGFYWTSDVSDGEPVRLIITHEGGSEFSYSFSTVRPTFASSVRCIANGGF